MCLSWNGGSESSFLLVNQTVNTERRKIKYVIACCTQYIQRAAPAAASAFSGVQLGAPPSRQSSSPAARRPQQGLCERGVGRKRRMMVARGQSKMQQRQHAGAWNAAPSPPLFTTMWAKAARPQRTPASLMTVKDALEAFNFISINQSINY